jgi:hypothetical protein
LDLRTQKPGKGSKKGLDQQINATIGENLATTITCEPGKV